MKNRVLIMAALLLGSLHLLAQNKVTGTVTDKDGNPIPGAKVEVKGGTESTITELDGTFVLETKSPVKKVKVYYVGMQSKEQKVKPDMLIKMSDSSWWREKPDKYRWFLGVQGTFVDVEDLRPSFGLMVGRVKNIGWYVKGLYSYVSSSGDQLSSFNDSYSYWLTGDSDFSYWNATGGVICRMWCPIHLYVGGGYFSRSVVWKTYDGTNLDYSPDCISGFTADAGLMLKMKRVFVNLGMSMNFGKTELCDYFAACNFGIGYFF